MKTLYLIFCLLFSLSLVSCSQSKFVPQASVRHGIENSKAKNCFMVVEKNKLLRQEGNCHERHSPCSTFKIPLSLMGFNEGILSDATHPEYPFKKGYAEYLDSWKDAQNPTTWMKNSCVWYSQILTQKMGAEKFQDYVNKFDYGNQDLSGDKGKNNGLINSWLSSSLQISPAEQIEFLQKLLENRLSVSKCAHQQTKDILFVEELPKGWRLYGKTGSGHNKHGQIGWFIGWLEKGARTIIFANYIEDPVNSIFIGKKARELAKEWLSHLIIDQGN